MDTTSLWEAISTRSSTYPALAKDIEVDVAIKALNFSLDDEDIEIIYQFPDLLLPTHA